MWTTILTVLLLTWTVDLGAAGGSPARKEVANATESGNRTGFGHLSENDGFTRLRIRNQTGFDGKVRNIRIDNGGLVEEEVEEERAGVDGKGRTILIDNGGLVAGEDEERAGVDGKVRNTRLDNGGLVEEEERAGVRAYGAPKKHLREYGMIEQVPLPESATEDTRNGRLIQAYGMAVQRLGTNGVIERLTTPATWTRDEADPRNRQRRSIEGGSERNGEEKQELEDLEAQDAKVFRPLFVYRRQQAKKQRLHRDNSPPYPYNQHGKSYYATRY